MSVHLFSYFLKQEEAIFEKINTVESIYSSRAVHDATETTVAMFFVMMFHTVQRLFLVLFEQKLKYLVVEVESDCGYTILGSIHGCFLT